MFVNTCSSAVDFFTNTSESFNNTNGARPRLTPGMLVFLVVWVALVLLLGQYLWNNVLCPHVTFCKPVKSVWMILGLVVLLDILKPCCC